MLSGDWSSDVCSSDLRAVFVNHEQILHSREQLFVPTSSHGGTLNLTRLKQTDSSFATSHVPPDNQTQSLTATSEPRETTNSAKLISTRRTRVLQPKLKGKYKVTIQVQQYMKPRLQLQTDRPTQSLKQKKKNIKILHKNQRQRQLRAQTAIGIHSETILLLTILLHRTTTTATTKEDLHTQGPCSKAPFLPTTEDKTPPSWPCSA